MPECEKIAEGLCNQIIAWKKYPQFAISIPKYIQETLYGVNLGIFIAQYSYLSSLRKVNVPEGQTWYLIPEVHLLAGFLSLILSEASAASFLPHIVDTYSIMMGTSGIMRIMDRIGSRDATSVLDADTYLMNNRFDADIFDCMFFQVVYTLCVLYDVLGFHHNDLHWSNILLQFSKVGNHMNYCINDTMAIRIPWCGFVAKIIDFDMSSLQFDTIHIMSSPVLISNARRKGIGLQSVVGDVTNMVRSLYRFIYSKAKGEYMNEYADSVTANSIAWTMIQDYVSRHSQYKYRSPTESFRHRVEMIYAEISEIDMEKAQDFWTFENLVEYYSTKYTTMFIPEDVPKEIDPTKATEMVWIGRLDQKEEFRQRLGLG